jgi:hypothetical protein
MRRLFPAFLLLIVSMMGVAAQPAFGQIAELPTRVEPRITPPLPVPFGPGELLEYDVKLGFLGKRGEGHMAVVGLDTVRGRTTYQLEMAYQGGVPLARVRDHFRSWVDVTNLVTLRSIEDTHQINRKRYKHFELFPEDQRWERADKVESGDMPTTIPLDQMSFFYFVRSVPLEVGKEYTFNRYYKESGNPVILQVLKKDTVKVPAGTFPTVVVRPIIRSSGLFGQGGEAELYFTDDDRRLLVMMKSKVPLIGALSLHLRRITEGHPLMPVGDATPQEARARLSLPPPTSSGGSGPGGSEAPDPVREEPPPGG